MTSKGGQTGGDVDEDRDDDDPTAPCPNCGRDIYDDAEWCPHCGKYLSREEFGSSKRPWWFVASVVVCLIIILGWVIG
ncbi:MAG: zinc-ribbon domain-containing protein [Isosphaeraceae bacterium]